MQEDVFGELNALFQQVSIEKWFEKVRDVTFRTENFHISDVEARAILRKNRAERKELPAACEEVEEVLKTLKARLQEYLQTNFMTSKGVRVFAKLQDRSPKDAEYLGTKIEKLFNERINERSKSNKQYSNEYLQAYIWAKCRALIAESADEVLLLLTTSERACSELEMKLELSSEIQQVDIILREAVEFDPALEFRGFVSRNKLTAISQMATMDTNIHYPQLKELQEEIINGSQQFYNSIAKRLEFIIEAGPADMFVIDMFYDKEHEKWYLVELNPFQTSSMGHLFKFWDYDDMKTLRDGPFEFRYHTVTKLEFLELLPDVWKQKCIEHDTYDIDESSFQPSKSSSPSSSQSKNNNNNNIDNDDDINNVEEKRERNLLDLFRSSNDSDSEIVIGERSFKVHSKILIERSESFASFYQSISPSMILHFDESQLSAANLQAILEFIYTGEEVNNAWDCEDWNELFIAVLDNNFFDLNDKLIAWRTEQAAGSEKTLYGDPELRIFPGWKRGSQSNQDALSFSLEIEGCGLQILQFYRPESISEDRWLSLPLTDRYNYINRNWAKLKKRIDHNAFYWMNKNLTIEDSGFLWEVSYGGNSAGYTLDLNHLLDQYSQAIDQGLSLCDRDWDSGVQTHIAFPLFQDESSSVRRTVLALMIHLDDFAFLNHFAKYIYDDCNNLWTDQDISNLFNAEEKGLEEFEGWISRKGMPNPSVKHKHIGLRGIDTYRVPNRFGFEFRRGFDTEELPLIMKYISHLLSLIGYHSNDHIKVRFCWLEKFFRSAFRSEYSMSDVVRWIQSSARSCPDDGSIPDDLLFDDQLSSLIEPWVSKLVQWEYHLINIKNLIWGNNVSTQLHDLEIEEKAKRKIRRRISFLLFSDWRQFPSYSQASLYENLYGEAAFIRSQINKLLGKSDREKLLLESQKADSHSAEIIRKQLISDDVRLVDARDIVIDYAGRLSRLF